MKTTYLMALAILALTGCGNKAADTSAPADDAPAPPKAQTVRLVGTISIMDDASVSGKAGKAGERKGNLQGTIDQLVTVDKDAEDGLNFHPVGGGLLILHGTVTETGYWSTDSPDDNMIVKLRGKNDHQGKLTTLSLGIRPSKLGVGDEVSMAFDVPMTGKLTMQGTTRQGQVIDISEGGTAFMSILEPDTSDPAKRRYKRDFLLLPSLGATPTDAFAKMMYDGFKAHPGAAHLGLATAPGRQGWSYSGVKKYGKAGGDMQWDERIELKLNLTKP